MNAYDEVVEFIASRNPQAVVEFKPSDAARDRVWKLIEAQKQGELPSEEAAELARYMELEHLMRLAKARARQLMAHAR